MLHVWKWWMCYFINFFFIEFHSKPLRPHRFSSTWKISFCIKSPFVHMGQNCSQAPEARCSEMLVRLTKLCCNQRRNFAGKWRQSRNSSRSHSKAFPLHFIFNTGPKIVRAIYVHVLREMYKRRRLFKRSERLLAARALESFLRPSDSSSSDFYARFSISSQPAATFLPSRDNFPTRVASILMFPPSAEIAERFKIWFQNSSDGHSTSANSNFPFAFTSKFNAFEPFRYACIFCSDWHNLV